MPPDHAFAEPACAFGFAAVLDADLPVLLALACSTIGVILLGWLA